MSPFAIFYGYGRAARTWLVLTSPLWIWCVLAVVAFDVADAIQKEASK